MRNFEWSFQGVSSPNRLCSSASILVGIRFDDHGSQMTLSFEVDSERLDMFLRALHDITNYDGLEYRQRMATLKSIYGIELTMTGLLCESADSMCVDGFSCRVTQMAYGGSMMWTFDLFGNRDVLEFCHDGWHAINEVRDDGDSNQ